MHRIASAILIAAVVLAMNGGMLREAFGGDLRGATVLSRADVPQPSVHNTRLLSLLVVLESLRQASASPDAQKV